MTWQATVLTIFPEMLPGPLAYSLAGKALAAGRWRLDTVDIRDFAPDRHRSVDDAPFGGGPGMVMRADVLDAAIAGAGGTGPLILLSPRGSPARPGARRRIGRRTGGAIDLRPVRGGRRARRRSPRDRGNQPRRLCPVRRRAGGDCADRRLRAPAAGCRRRRRSTRRGELCRGTARIPALHPAAAVAGPGSAGSIGFGRPWPHPRVAPGRGRAPDARAARRFVGTATWPRRGMAPAPTANAIERSRDERSATTGARAGRAARRRPPGAEIRARRHGPRQPARRRRRARAHPGLRRRVHRPQERRHQFELYLAQDFVRRGRRARLSALFAADHRDRRAPPRRRAPGQALLSARPHRQGGAHRRARPRQRASGKAAGAGQDRRRRQRSE